MSLNIWIQEEKTFFTYLEWYIVRYIKLLLLTIYVLLIITRMNQNNQLKQIKEKYAKNWVNKFRSSFYITKLNKKKLNQPTNTWTIKQYNVLSSFEMSLSYHQSNKTNKRKYKSSLNHYQRQRENVASFTQLSSMVFIGNIKSSSLTHINTTCKSFFNSISAHHS